MRMAWFVTHPEVAIDPAVPVPDRGLSAAGRLRATWPVVALPRFYLAGVPITGAGDRPRGDGSHRLAFGRATGRLPSLRRRSGDRA